MHLVNSYVLQDTGLLYPLTSDMSASIPRLSGRIRPTNIWRTLSPGALMKREEKIEGSTLGQHYPAI